MSNKVPAAVAEYDRGRKDALDRVRAWLDPGTIEARMDAAAGVDSEVVRFLRRMLDAEQAS